MNTEQHNFASTQPQMSDLTKLSLDADIKHNFMENISRTLHELLTTAVINECGTLAYFLNLARIEAEKLAAKAGQEL